MNQMMKNLMSTLVAILAIVLMAAPASALDKVVMKDGSIVEGEIKREINGAIWITVSIGGIETERFLAPGTYSTIERDSAEPVSSAPIAKADENRKASPKRDGVERVAVLTLEEMVGMYMSAKPLHDAIPLLEEDEVDTVVLKINSGGGYLLEIQRLSDVIHNEYKPRFRVVAWIESAISAAAMSAHCVEEIYFMPQGNYGACTGYSGPLVAVKGYELEKVLYMMEKISDRGGYDIDIMRAMQINDEGLSASFDQNGDVQWYRGDDAGDDIVSEEGKILTFNSQTASKYKFSKGTCANIEELAEAMKLNEYEFVGKTVQGVPYPVCAAEEMQREWRESMKIAETRFNEYFAKYGMSVQNAQSSQDRQTRAAFVNKARRELGIIRNVVRKHPIFEEINGLTDEWFRDQEEMLRDLMR
ncbi:MAG: hypothetical protein KDA28_11130 [Phycisphaerales bacterium]|nr:hypothetical protein [Phycisphaerales bacterium]